MVELVFGLFMEKEALGFLVKLVQLVCICDSLVPKLFALIVFRNIAILLKVDRIRS